MKLSKGKSSRSSGGVKGVTKFFAKLRVGSDASRKSISHEEPPVVQQRLTARTAGNSNIDLSKFVGREEPASASQLRSTRTRTTGPPNTGRSREPPIVVAIMGVTGSGKSTFCKTVTGRREVKVGDTLSSETSKVQSYEIDYGGRQYVLVDTPGFDDTNRPDGEITKTILTWLKESFETGTQLNGVIYLHRIVDPRMTGTALRNSMMFRKLVGPDAFQNVVLATTFWEMVPESTGIAREKELCSTDNFWGGMMKKNSRVFRLKKNRASGLELLSLFANKNKVTLEAQDEMLNHGVSIEQTAAAREQKSQAERLEAELMAKNAAEKKRMEEETARREKIRRERLARERRELEQKRQEELRIAREREEREQREEAQRRERERIALIQEQRRQEERRRREAEELRRAMEAEEERREQERVRILTAYYESYVCVGHLPKWPCDKCGEEFDGEEGYYHCCHCQSDMYFHCESCGNDCGEDDHPYMGRFNVVTTYTKSDPDCIVM